MRLISVIAIAGGMLATACSQTGKFQTFEKAIDANLESLQAYVAPPPILETPFTRQTFSNDSIFQLSPNQTDMFFSYFNAPEHENVAPHIRISEFLKHSTTQFTYKGATLNAYDAFSQQSGNCLSLAILSTAIVELVDLRYRYTEVHTPPMYSETGDVQFISSHVNLRVYNNADHTDSVGTIIPGSVLIDYFPVRGAVRGKVISRDDIIVKYWHNLASEAIANSDYNLAFSYTMMANDINRLDPETLNLLAILYARVGRIDKAYEVYNFLDDKQILSYTSANNFAALLTRNKQMKRANALLNRVKTINDENPYTWLYAAKRELEIGNYRLAEEYLLKSVELAPYLHEIHFNLALVYKNMSKNLAAKESLISAMALASEPDAQRRYKAKIHSLLE